MQANMQQEIEHRLRLEAIERHHRAMKLQNRRIKDTIFYMNLAGFCVVMSLVIYVLMAFLNPFIAAPLAIVISIVLAPILKQVFIIAFRPKRRTRRRN
jgi:hypothetical protein